MSFRGTPHRRGYGLRDLTTIIILLALAAACGGSSTDVQTQSEAGTYHLVTVNGQSLPVSVTTTSGTVSIQSATVVLTSGTPSTYTASMTGANGPVIPKTSLQLDAFLTCDRSDCSQALLRYSGGRAARSFFADLSTGPTGGRLAAMTTA